MLAWPHEGTDWAPILAAAEDSYVALSRAILDHEQLLILCPDRHHQARIQSRLAAAGARLGAARFAIRNYDDTWARDFGPLAVGDDRSTRLQDFRFNGWGGKYQSDADDRLNGTLAWRRPLDQHRLVLEGGSVDTDGRGTLLTTRACLLNPNRNPDLDQPRIERRLRDALGIRDFVWLDHGALAGDDTDAHVDTLARFCDADTLAYVQCRDPRDSHYPGLRAMEEQLRREAAARHWRLLPLPLPPACFSAEGERLPATYANFLIINGAVLVPVYGVASDRLALDILAKAFPGRRTVAVNCRALIEQHGSLHCATMQLPQGVF